MIRQPTNLTIKEMKEIAEGSVKGVSPMERLLANVVLDLLDTNIYYPRYQGPQDDS